MPNYICQKKQHNKFWRYEVEGLFVDISWGRIGGKEQSQRKRFSSTFALENFLSKKIKGKESKGYRLVDEKKLEQEEKTAKTLGTQYKIKQMKFVHKKGKRFSFIDSYDPNHHVYVQVLNSWSKDVTHLLLKSGGKAVILNGGVEVSSKGLTVGTVRSVRVKEEAFVEAVKGILERLSDKVVVAVKKFSFASVGARKLDDDFTDENNLSYDLEEVIKEVSDSSVEEQVVAQFAGMGRKLEL